MTARAPTTQSIDTLAANWLMRRDSGLSPTAASELRAWLAADPAHQAAFDRLGKTLAVFDRAAQSGISEAVITRLKIRARERRSRRIAVTSAALILLATGFWWAPRSLFAPAAAPVVAVIAADPVRKLPDGSIVELNAGADIAVRYEPMLRRVHLLRGEAHFRVEKDPSRPFIVELAHGVEVRAVGTAFTVQLIQDKAEVVVTEGRVAVEQPAAAKSAAPGEGVPTPNVMAFVDAGHRLFVDLTAPAATPVQPDALSESELETRLAWRIPQLEFKGMTLGEAIALMNRQNRLQITLDPAIASLRISGTFRSDDPEGFVRIVTATFGLQSAARGEQEVALTQ